MTTTMTTTPMITTELASYQGGAQGVVGQVRSGRRRAGFAQAIPRGEELMLEWVVVRMGGGGG